MRSRRTKAQRSNSLRMHSVGQTFLMTLIQKIPNIQFSIMSPNDNNSRSCRTETSTCQIRRWIRRTENRFIDSFFSDTKIEIVNGQNDIFEKRRPLKRHSGSVTSFGRQNKFDMFGSWIFSGSCDSIHIHQIPFITSHSELRVVLICIKQ